MSDKLNCQYDYANKCDCSEDDKCGCDYPNNIPHDYNMACLTEEETEAVATEAPMVTSAFDGENSKPEQRETGERQQP